MGQREDSPKEGRIDFIRLRAVGHVSKEQIDFERCFKRFQGVRPEIQGLGLQLRRQEFQAFVVDIREFAIRYGRRLAPRSNA